MVNHNPDHVICFHLLGYMLNDLEEWKELKAIPLSTRNPVLKKEATRLQGIIFDKMKQEARSDPGKYAQCILNFKEGDFKGPCNFFRYDKKERAILTKLAQAHARVKVGMPWYHVLIAATIYDNPRLQQIVLAGMEEGRFSYATLQDSIQKDAGFTVQVFVRDYVYPYREERRISRINNNRGSPGHGSPGRGGRSSPGRGGRSSPDRGGRSSPGRNGNVAGRSQPLASITNTAPGGGKIQSKNHRSKGGGNPPRNDQLLPPIQEERNHQGNSPSSSNLAASDEDATPPSAVDELERRLNNFQMGDNLFGLMGEIHEARQAFEIQVSADTESRNAARAKDVDGLYRNDNLEARAEKLNHLKEQIVVLQEIIQTEQALTNSAANSERCKKLYDDVVEKAKSM